MNVLGFVDRNRQKPLPFQVIGFQAEGEGSSIRPYQAKGVSMSLEAAHFLGKGAGNRPRKKHNQTQTRKTTNNKQKQPGTQNFKQKSKILLVLRARSKQIHTDISPVCLVQKLKSSFSAVEFFFIGFLGKIYHKIIPKLGTF